MGQLGLQALWPRGTPAGAGVLQTPKALSREEGAGELPGAPAPPWLFSAPRSESLRESLDHSEARKQCPCRVGRPQPDRTASVPLGPRSWDAEPSLVPGRRTLGAVSWDCGWRPALRVVGPTGVSSPQLQEDSGDALPGRPEDVRGPVHCGLRHQQEARRREVGRPCRPLCLEAWRRAARVSGFCGEPAGLSGLRCTRPGGPRHPQAGPHQPRTRGLAEACVWRASALFGSLFTISVFLGRDSHRGFGVIFDAGCW